MPVRCAQCATEMPDGMRFCGACGAPLEGPPTAPRERRLVSVLFCDLVGFTTFSETRDHEDVRDTLEHYFAAARRVVEAYGGTIEKFIGDAVMAVWGAPIAQEDDAERAVRAGLDIATAVAGLAGRLNIPELQLRVGILTGEAAVDIGNVHQGMVIGDAVNTAARIQSLAPAGEVFVDDITRLATERAVAYEPAGTHAVKGKTDGVRVWRAVQVVSLRGGAGRPGAVESPLVGREREIARLRNALDHLLTPGAGAGLATVDGEAGLGKSRLAWELQKYADGIAGQVRWLSGRIPAFGESTGLSALAEIFRGGARLSLEDPPEVQRRGVTAWLETLFEPGSVECERAEWALHRLLELHCGPEAIEPVEPGALFSAWRAVLERVAAQTPVLLLLEELQLAEATLLAFVVHLLEWAPAAPILIVAVGRPGDWTEPLAPLGERLELAPLSDEAMDALVRGIVRDPPDTLLRSVRADGGGVPLFAVETLRALADSGALAVVEGRYVLQEELGELTVAPTIRALVASRLDRLGALERRALAGGAVLGERFPNAGAAAVAELDPTDARTLLDGLVVKAMLRPESADALAGDGYGFLQGMVRRVLMSTLARRDRRRLHLAAAEFLRRGRPVPEMASQLAGHLLAAVRADPDAPDAAGLRRRAGETLREAAERAGAVGALEEAVALLDHAAELTDDEGERAGLLEQAGAVAQRAGTPDVAAERYRQAGALHAGARRERARLAARAHELRALRYVRSAAEIVDEFRELDRALAGSPDAASALAGAVLAFTLYQLGEPAEALAVAERAVRTAEACGASAELVMGLAAQATSLGELERPEEAVAVYERGLALVIGRNERLVATIGGNLAVALGALGRFADSVGQAREALAAADRAADRVFARWNRLVVGRGLCSLGDWDGAEAELEAVRDQVPPFQLGMAAAPLVTIALARGDLPRVRELVEDYDRRCQDAGASVFEGDFRALRSASIAWLAGGSQALARVIPEAEAADLTEWSGWVRPVVDALLANRDTNPDGPIAALSALQGPGRMLRTEPVQAQAERLAGHLAASAGDRPGAAEHLSRARALAASCGMRFEAAQLSLEAAEVGVEVAAAELVEAAATFRELGAEPWRRRAEAATEALRRSAGPGAPGPA